MVNDKESNEKLFAAWLAQNAPSSQLSELYLCYPEIEAYCIKTKVLHKPLFETTDLETVHKVQKIISESRIFKFSRRKQMKRFVAAAQYYTSFVKILDTQKASDDTSLTAQSASTVSVEENKTMLTGKKRKFQLKVLRRAEIQKLIFVILSALHIQSPSRSPILTKFSRGFQLGLNYIRRFLYACVKIIRMNFFGFATLISAVDGRLTLVPKRHRKKWRCPRKSMTIFTWRHA